MLGCKTLSPKRSVGLQNPNPRLSSSTSSALCNLACMSLHHSSAESGDAHCVRQLFQATLPLHVGIRWRVSGIPRPPCCGDVAGDCLPSSGALGASRNCGDTAATAPSGLVRLCIRDRPPAVAPRQRPPSLQLCAVASRHRIPLSAASAQCPGAAWETLSALGRGPRTLPCAITWMATAQDSCPALFLKNISMLTVSTFALCVGFWSSVSTTGPTLAVGLSSVLRPLVRARPTLVFPLLLTCLLPKCTRFNRSCSCSPKPCSPLRSVAEPATAHNLVRPPGAGACAGLTVSRWNYGRTVCLSRAAAGQLAFRRLKPATRVAAAWQLRGSSRVPATRWCKSHPSLVTQPWPPCRPNIRTARCQTLLALESPVRGCA